VSDRSGGPTAVTGLSVTVNVHGPLINEQSTNVPSTTLTVVVHIALPLQSTFGCLIEVRPALGEF